MEPGKQFFPLYRLSNYQWIKRILWITYNRVQGPPPKTTQERARLKYFETQRHPVRIYRGIVYSREKPYGRAWNRT